MPTFVTVDDYIATQSAETQPGLRCASRRQADSRGPGAQAGVDQSRREFGLWRVTTILAASRVQG